MVDPWLNTLLPGVGGSTIGRKNPSNPYWAVTVWLALAPVWSVSPGHVAVTVCVPAPLAV